MAVGLVATRSNEIGGLGLATKGHHWSEGQRSGSSSRANKSQLKCDHCGMTKHTKELCFKIVCGTMDTNWEAKKKGGQPPPWVMQTVPTTMVTTRKAP